MIGLFYGFVLYQFVSRQINSFSLVTISADCFRAVSNCASSAFTAF